MGIPPNFPRDPHVILHPDARWIPATDAQHSNMPPLVPALRKAVKEWRDSDYAGAHATSRALLAWWFERKHPVVRDGAPTSYFQYYFAQREALETIIYLHDVVAVKDKVDLMRFDRSGKVSTGMFEEDWRRFVVKMATGSGKTKVMSLVLAWCYYHKMYEPNSDLARNFLMIAPNIIVLDRLRADFDGLRIFYGDPVLPDNGFEGRNWRDDFQLKIHIQDQVNVTQPVGNIFLTNIHRVYSRNDAIPSASDANTMDYFLGARPTGATTDSKVDLGDIVKNIDELVVINDEAHHIHNSKLAWFKSIQGIHLSMIQKGKSLALQIDVTATPKHNNGHVFAQTISDYPLVEAISQNVVKHPVVPDKPSQAKLHEGQSARFVEKYADYINLGIVEWRKTYEYHKKLGKKSVLFVMTDNTKNCDDVAAYLQNMPEFKDAVLTIHTNNNGEISETTTGKKAKELEILRKQSNEIDKESSPYKAIVSVLMLKEGWDVQNVTTIVGLRPYSAKSNILPEQTLGRGLRRMYRDKDDGVDEYVSVVGTKAFMAFVESIKDEGVELEEWQMGPGAEPKVPLIIEVDRENADKDLTQLDIEIPVMSRRHYREYKNLETIDLGALVHRKLIYQQYNEEEQREIVFRYITNDEMKHTTKLDGGVGINYQDAVRYFTDTIANELHLVSGQDVVFGLVKDFIAQHLFTKPVPLDNRNTLRNLAEPAATQMIIETFKNTINKVTLDDKGGADIKGCIKVSEVRPFRAQEQNFHTPQKSIFNKIIGDSSLELEFAAFLDGCADIVSYAKNYFAVGFTLDYINASGDISNYYPDFFVKKSATEVYIVETKGQEDTNVAPKTKRLKQWCEDVNKVSTVKYDFVYVDEASFNKYKPTSFDGLVRQFTSYKD